MSKFNQNEPSSVATAAGQFVTEANVSLPIALGNVEEAKFWSNCAIRSCLTTAPTEHCWAESLQKGWLTAVRVSKEP